MAAYLAIMELRHLRYFQAVAELLNFSRAAERLRVAQPALSRQIRNLEEELGTRLFDRNRVRVQMTDAGRVFYSHTCKILAEVDMATHAAREAVRGESGELIVCHDWRISNQLLSKTIVDFRKKNPRVEVLLQDVPMHEQLGLLRARRAHVGFVMRNDLGARPELDFLPIMRTELQLIVSENHRLAKEESVRIAQLADETWLLVDEKLAPGFRGYINQICRISGFAPKFGKKAHTAGGLLALVATGYGICILPDSVILENPMVRFLGTDCLSLEMCAVWNRGEDSNLLRQYLAILKGRLAQQVERTGAMPKNTRAAPGRRRLV